MRLPIYQLNNVECARSRERLHVHCACHCHGLWKQYRNITNTFVEGTRHRGNTEYVGFWRCSPAATQQAITHRNTHENALAAQIKHNQRVFCITENNTKNTDCVTKRNHNNNKITRNQVPWRWLMYSGFIIFILNSERNECKLNFPFISLALQRIIIAHYLMARWSLPVSHLTQSAKARSLRLPLYTNVVYVQ